MKVVNNIFFILKSITDRGILFYYPHIRPCSDAEDKELQRNRDHTVCSIIQISISLLSVLSKIRRLYILMQLGKIKQLIRKTYTLRTANQQTQQNHLFFYFCDFFCNSLRTSAWKFFTSKRKMPNLNIFRGLLKLTGGTKNSSL